MVGDKSIWEWIDPDESIETLSPFTERADSQPLAKIYSQPKRLNGLIAMMENAVLQKKFRLPANETVLATFQVASISS
jgi:hypothetical protein